LEDCLQDKDYAGFLFCSAAFNISGICQNELCKKGLRNRGFELSHPGDIQTRTYAFLRPPHIGTCFLFRSRTPQIKGRWGLHANREGTSRRIPCVITVDTQGREKSDCRDHGLKKCGRSAVPEAVREKIGDEYVGY